eukprot:IDg16372t1
MQRLQCGFAPSLSLHFRRVLPHTRTSLNPSQQLSDKPTRRYAHACATVAAEQKRSSIQKKYSPPKKGNARETKTAAELRAARLAKVDAMREAGVNPYAYSFNTTSNAATVIADNQQLETGKAADGPEVSLAGRIMARRVFGKLAFFT